MSAWRLRRPSSYEGFSRPDIDLAVDPDQTGKATVHPVPEPRRGGGQIRRRQPGRQVRGTHRQRDRRRSHRRPSYDQRPNRRLAVSRHGGRGPVGGEGGARHRGTARQDSGSARQPQKGPAAKERRSSARAIDIAAGGSVTARFRQWIIQEVLLARRWQRQGYGHGRGRARSRCQEPAGTTCFQFATDGMMRPAGPWPKSQNKLPVIFSTAAAGQSVTCWPQGFME